jgi:hypothetical protein
MQSIDPVVLLSLREQFRQRVSRKSWAGEAMVGWRCRFGTGRGPLLVLAPENFTLQKLSLGERLRECRVGAERGEQSTHESHPKLSATTFTFTLAEMAAMTD